MNQSALPMNAFRGIIGIFLIFVLASECHATFQETKDSRDSIANNNPILVNTGYEVLDPSLLPHSTTLYREDFNKGLISSPYGLVNGKLDGLLFYRSDSKTGNSYTISNLRNQALLGTNRPQVLLDGVPVSSSFLPLNPNDIESISYVRDAGAAGIGYTSATNGALLISTFKQSDELAVDFTTKAAISKIQKKMPVLSGDQLRQVIYDAYSDNPDVLSRLGNENTDWQDAIYRNAFGMEHHIRISGKAGPVPLSISLGRMDRDGIIGNTWEKSTTVAIRLAPDLFDEQLKLRFSMNGAWNNWNSTMERIPIYAVSYNPTLPLDYQAVLPDELINPVDMMNSWTDAGDERNLLLALDLEYRFKGLPQVSLNLNSVVQQMLQYSQNYFDLEAWPDCPEQMQDRSKSEYRLTTQTEDLYLAWNTSDPDKPLQITARAGMRLNLSNYNYTNILSSYTIDSLSYSLLGVWNTDFLLFENIRFSYKNTYSLALNLFDKVFSTNLVSVPANKLFPSAVFTWNMKNEAFLKGVNLINSLSLSASASWSFQNGDYISYPYVYYSNEPEKYASFNLSANGSFFNNRLGMDLNLFEIKGTEMFMLQYILTGSGSYYVATNSSSIQNKGLSASLQGRLIDRPNARWTLEGGVSVYKHSLSYLGGLDIFYMPVYYSNFPSPRQAWEIGAEPLAFMLRKQLYAADGSMLEGQYEDLDTPNDEYLFDQVTPRLTAHFSTNLQIRNWVLACSGRAQRGNHVYNQWTANSYLYKSSNMYFIQNLPASFAEDPISSLMYNSDYYMQNAAFLRMDYISLGYTFKHLWNNSISLDVTLVLQNAFTLTTYEGQEPESDDGLSYLSYPLARTGLIQLGLHF